MIPESQRKEGENMPDIYTPSWASQTRRMNKGKTVMARLPDTGDRYLSTPLLEDEAYG